jgi:hypothetical protein
MGQSGCDISFSKISIGFREVSARHNAATGSVSVTLVSCAGLLSFGASLQEVATSAITAATAIIVSIFFIISSIILLQST